MGLIAFRSQTTLAAIAAGLNLANTAFFTPALLLAEGMNQLKVVEQALFIGPGRYPCGYSDSGYYSHKTTKLISL